MFYPPEKEGRMWERSEPMLPMTDRWEDADSRCTTLFDLVRMFGPGEKRVRNGGVSLRDGSIKLLSRYPYIYGKSIPQPLLNDG